MTEPSLQPMSFRTSQRQTLSKGVIAGLLACSFALPLAYGNEPVPAKPSAAHVATTQPLRAGRLDAGDLVSVTIDGLTSAGSADTLLVRVDGEGRIKLPYVGQMAVRHLTTDRAADAISKKLREKQIIVDAVVSVGIAKRASESALKPGPLVIGDKLQITIYDLSGPALRYTAFAEVDTDGTVVLPFVGAVKLEGLSEAEADGLIAKQYKEKQVIAEAIISTLRLEPDGLP